MKLELTLLGILLTCAVLQAADDTPQITNNAAKATKQRIKHPDAVFTDYRIQVMFGTNVPLSMIKRHMFEVKDKGNDSVVTVKAYTRSGGQIVEGDVVKIMGVNLDGDYDATRPYRVTVLLPDQEPIILDTVPIEGKNTNGVNQPWVNFHYRHLSVDLNPFAADEDNAFGLKYDLRYQVVHKYLGEGLFNIDLQTHGEFSISKEENSTNSIQNSLKGGLTASYLYNVRATLPLGDEFRTYVYPLGFRVSPAEFEANKSFSDVNYTAKILLGGAIPYADYPALLWNKAFNVDVPFFAPTLFTGFAALSEVKDDSSDTLSKLGHTRWDTEFIYALPLHRRVDFKFISNWYVGLEKGFWKNNYEVGAILYMDDKRTHGFTLFRQKGALPPDFIKTESWRIGYTATF